MIEMVLSAELRTQELHKLHFDHLTAWVVFEKGVIAERMVRHRVLVEGETHSVSVVRRGCVPEPFRMHYWEKAPRRNYWEKALRRHYWEKVPSRRKHLVMGQVVPLPLGLGCKFAAQTPGAHTDPEADGAQMGLRSRLLVVVQGLCDRL